MQRTTDQRVCVTGAKLVLHGNLAAEGFGDWICHRARLLDLTGSVKRKSPDCMVITVSGPPALLDAMETACSLGPLDVMVERIERHTNPPDITANGFQMC